MDKFILKIKNIINDIKQDKTKKTIATISLIVVCFFAFNLGGLLNKVLTSITSILSNETEIKTVEFTSDGYDTEEDGSFKVTKHADWTSTSTAQITWTMESYIEKDSVKKDIILVLDTSASMDTQVSTINSSRDCTRLECSKIDIKSFISYVLKENENRIGLIIFNDSASILTNLTNNEEDLLNLIDGLGASGDTNYNQALIKVEEILSTYTETEGREVEVLFITDGYPNIETPNQNVQYKLLKERYPFITIHGIQFEMGESTIAELTKISDKQYVALTYLNNSLMSATFSPEAYEVFEIVDYINNDYFDVLKESDIKVSIGTVTLTAEDGVQKITWVAPNKVVTGNKYTMSVNLKLKDEYVAVKGLYPTNTREVINIKLPGGDLVNFDTTEVPKLKMPYKVTYDVNSPSDCNVSIDLVEEHYAFNTVEISNQKLECEGYQFKGWEVADKVTMINDDSFIMPTNDIIIKGTWSKLDLNKTIEGSVYEKLTIYKAVARKAVPDNITSEYVTSVTGIDFSTVPSTTNGKGVYTISSTLDNEYPIHYYRGDIDNNHVLFAGFCWEIVRTTDTGGVKLIYDGNPVDDTCPNTGNSSQITSNYYNYNYGTPSSLGYMYNKTDGMSDRSMIFRHSVLSSKSLASSQYYFSENVLYDETTGSYTLIDSSTYTWESNYSNLLGYYTCFSDTTTECSTVYYIAGSTSSYGYYISLENGKLNEDEILTYGTGVTDNGDGTYTLIDAVTIEKSDYYREYNNFRNKYVCSDLSSSTCSTYWYIDYTWYNSYDYDSSANNYVYGSSYTYDENTGTYTLVNTKQIWRWYSQYGTLKGHRYTCLSESDSCQTLYYILYAGSHDVDLVYLKNGDSQIDVLNELLADENVNKTNSYAKNYVDNWYASNMTEYTDYLEDTIYCNDRSIYSLEGWNENSGSLSNHYLYFNAGIRRSNGTPSLECVNETDRFTVDVKNGNGALIYPVGLITSDEIMYAGGSSSYTKHYLRTGKDYWTMSPQLFANRDGNSISSFSSRVSYVASGNATPVVSFNYGVRKSYGIRPMISIRGDLEYSRGAGTEESPYVIDLNSVE